MLEIVLGEDNPILRKISAPITKFDKSLKQFVSEMEKSVKKANGLGIAAPQVGFNDRIFLMRVKNRYITLINPEIIYFSEEKEIGEEGCLSLPKVWGKVERSKTVKVKFQDVKGNWNTMQFSDLEARIVQHEYDHLEGVLFIDKLVGELEGEK